MRTSSAARRGLTIAAAATTLAGAALVSSPGAQARPAFFQLVNRDGAGTTWTTRFWYEEVSPPLRDGAGVTAQNTLGFTACLGHRVDGVKQLIMRVPSDGVVYPVPDGLLDFVADCEYFGDVG